MSKFAGRAFMATSSVKAEPVVFKYVGFDKPVTEISMGVLRLRNVFANQFGPGPGFVRMLMALLGSENKKTYQREYDSKGSSSTQNFTSRHLHLTWWTSFQSISAKRFQ